MSVWQQNSPIYNSMIINLAKSKRPRSNFLVFIFYNPRAKPISIPDIERVSSAKLMIFVPVAVWQLCELLDRHVTNVSANCFYRLRQMRRIRRSLGNQSATTLVHALVSTRVDYCNSVLAAAPKTTTDKLQRVLNAAARVVSNTRKFNRGLSQLLHDELHWLDVPDRVAFKLIVTVHRCLNGRAPNHTSKTAKIILKLSVCVFLNILLKTVILN